MTDKTGLRFGFLAVAAGGLLAASACAPSADTADERIELSSVSRSSALTAGASGASYLVSFTSGAVPANADALVAAAGGTVAARYPVVGAILARSSDPGFAARLRSTAGVEAVGASHAMHSRIAPVMPPRSSKSHRPKPPRPPAGADPLSSLQWDMDQIHAPAAHAISVGKRSVLVGVLDSGIDAAHPDLAGQVDASVSVSCLGGIPDTTASVWSNDVIGHGTHVSGIIAAAKNGIGIVGVAPGVRLAAVKVAIDNVDLSDPTFALVFADAMVCGIDWAAAHDFDLMNASLTLDPTDPPVDDIFCSDDPDRAAVIKIVRAAVLRAARKKTTMVAATGNFFLDLGNLTSPSGAPCSVLPVETPRAIGVSGVGPTQQLAWYSDYGAGAVDLTGPGGDFLVLPNPVGQVLSSMPETSLFYQAAAGWDGQVQDCSSGTCAFYAYIEGTSMATPHATGVAALAISRFGKLTPEVVLAILSLTATPLACPPSPYDPAGTGMPATCVGPSRFNNFYGAGEVNALAVVK
jgi:subtilisin family serine protease